MTTSALADLWNEYLAAERDRIRAVMMPALDRFIDRLVEQPRSEWERWAKDLAAAVSDTGADTPVRFPLFHRVLVPVLVRGVLAKEAGCARWLASFESLLRNSREVELPPQLRTSIGLLMEAVAIDPMDALARRRLVDRLASYLEYTLHELPAGVLHGTDGATSQQCEELTQRLAEFVEHATITRQLDDFAELIRKCEFHYRAYGEYLRSHPRTGGYAKYLASLR